MQTDTTIEAVGQPSLLSESSACWCIYGALQTSLHHLPLAHGTGPILTHCHLRQRLNVHLRLIVHTESTNATLERCYLLLVSSHFANTVNLRRDPFFACWDDLNCASFAYDHIYWSSHLLLHIYAETIALRNWWWSREYTLREANWRTYHYLVFEPFKQLLTNVTVSFTKLGICVF